ncbi:SDR family oxidoreductase [Blastococcus sp. SYSU D00820]
MDEFEGRVAFITGAAGGIGLATATVLGAAGMRVVVTDMRAEDLAEARGRLDAKGATSHHYIELDVTDREAWSRAAEETERVFGPVHLLVNNPGVGMVGRVSSAGHADWDRSLAVELGGVINGVQTFLGRMLAHGEGGHIVNVSSLAGLTPHGFSGISSVAAAAVFGLTESLRTELAGSGIGVSVVCPGLTSTDTWGTRPPMPADSPPDLPPCLGLEIGMDPVELAERLLAGIRRNDLYVLPHAEFRQEIVGSFAPLLAACDAAPEPGGAGGRPPGEESGWVYTPEGRTGTTSGRR